MLILNLTFNNDSTYIHYGFFIGGIPNFQMACYYHLPGGGQSFDVLTNVKDFTITSWRNPPLFSPHMEGDTISSPHSLSHPHPIPSPEREGRKLGERDTYLFHGQIYEQNGPLLLDMYITKAVYSHGRITFCNGTDTVSTPMINNRFINITE
jgi:hypothetical protein